MNIDYFMSEAIKEAKFAFDNDEVFNVLPKDYSKIKNFVLQNATK